MKISDIEKAVESVDGIEEAYIHGLLHFAKGSIELKKVGKKDEKRTVVKIQLELPTLDLFENPESIPMSNDEWKMVPVLMFIKETNDEEEES